MSTQKQLFDRNSLKGISKNSTPRTPLPNQISHTNAHTCSIALSHTTAICISERQQNGDTAHARAAKAPSQETATDF